MQKIAVTISALGVAKIDAQGFSGMSCAAATRPIEDALSGKAGDKAMKPEAYEIDTNSNHETQGY